jgi:Ca2+-transporting ATPase
MTEDGQKQNLQKPWTASIDDVIDSLDVDTDKGLSGGESNKRLEEYGKNRLQTEEEKSVFSILADQFKSLIILLLAVSALLSFVFGDYIEGFAILVVIFINAAIGFFTELQAVRSMEALRKLTQVTAKVLREGNVREINAQELVPGDVLVFNGGDVITADARLIETSKLKVNEAALTGESLPVNKQIDPVPEDTPLAERSNMVFKGTAVARGTGRGVIINTGMDSELGNISSLVQEAEEEVTPLQKRLDGLGRKLIFVTLGLAVIVVISGWAVGRDLPLMIQTAVALAVASIPEGLPIVATIALARGMQRMAKRKALINKLSSVETLGATSVIITDKTGTLTENQMTVTDITLDGVEVNVQGEGFELEGDFQLKHKDQSTEITGVLEELLKVGFLCNDASLTIRDGEVQQSVGEPMEIALKIAGQKAGLRDNDIQEKLPQVRKIAFEPSTKMMATVHEHEDDGYYYAIKGSPTAVLNVSTQVASPNGQQNLDDDSKQNWLDKNEAIANRGLRVIALAKKTTENEDMDPYENLTFLGLVGLMDPPREEVRSAIDRCRQAGIQVIMATGDHGETAREVARAVNLIDSDDAAFILGKDLQNIDNLDSDQRQEYLQTQIFARVNPEQKLDLIRLYQDEGEIVAMTGDGVNDAPALKKADIGVAMGQRGTQVAKEAADMVLEDDFFGTIVAAVEQGRTIFNNIRKFVLYLLSCNISEIMVVTLATVMNLPLPILPLQILFLNLVTDVFPALALGMGEGDPHLMEEPPRDSDEPIMTRRHWISMSVYGALITAAVLVGMTLAINTLGFSQTRSTTISFLILATAQLWHVFDMREKGTNIFLNAVTKNKFVWIALIITITLLLMAVYIPFLANLLSLTNPGLLGWLVVLVGSITPIIISQLLKKLKLVV